MRKEWSVLLLVLGLQACSDPHAHDSAIVREIEAAGSGRLDTADAAGILQFLSNHPALATRVDAQCAPLWEKGDAHWIGTAEEKACHAAKYAKPPVQWKADQRGW